MVDHLVDYNENLDSDDFIISPTDYNKIDDKDIYPHANIKVEREQYSIFELNRKFQKEEKQLILDPEFQREFVWKPRQQSELIESILMGIPLPIFYLNETKDGKLVVVDGRQRLSTFFSFLNNEFRLNELKILYELNGKDFTDLGQIQMGKLQATLEDFQIIAQVIKPSTPDRIKFDIFDRVNRGGTPLNQQEMRNALYQGKATALLKELAQTAIFKKATSESISSKRLKDRYMILRFLSFYLWRCNRLVDVNGDLIEYKNDIDDFLGKAMDFINRLEIDEIVDLKNIFVMSMSNNATIFGKHAFRRISNNDSRSPVNMLLFEAFGYLFSQFNSELCRENITLLLDNCFEFLGEDELNKLLLKDRGRGIVIIEIFEMIETLKESIVNDIQNSVKES